MSYKITPKISESSSRLLDEGGLTGAQALNYNPSTGDFDLTQTASSGDYIHYRTVYVDPNGANDSGEFGNRNKPFRSPIAALFAAFEQMQGLNFTPSGFVDSQEGEPDVSRAPWNRITIEVASGFYDYTADEFWLLTKGISVGSGRINLMYNYIDWYCQPGAVMYGYEFDDTYNYFNLLTTQPVMCNVYGDGTWVGQKVPGGNSHIYLENEKSVLSFNAEFSSMLYYIFGNSVLNYNAKKHVIEPYGKATTACGLENGQINYNVDKVVWRLKEDGENSSIYNFFYQGGGELNINVKQYYANNVLDSDWSPFYTQYFGGTGGTGAVFNAFVWDDKDVNPAPGLGYFEQYDENVPSISNIRIDEAKFAQTSISYIANFDGGINNFYAGNIDVEGYFFDGQICVGFYLGGPYYANVPSKFSLYGGKIKFNNVDIGGGIAYGLNIYDDPQVYIKDTEFIFNPIGATSSQDFSKVFGVYFDGIQPQTYQSSVTILDGIKMFTGATSNVAYSFGVIGATSADIKIYGNCFSNFNPIGSTGGSVNNLITGTSFIIDSNVQLI